MANMRIGTSMHDTGTDFPQVILLPLSHLHKLLSCHRNRSRLIFSNLVSTPPSPYMSQHPYTPIILHVTGFAFTTGLPFETVTVAV